MAEVVNLFLLAAAWGFGASLATPEAKRELSEAIIAEASLDPAVVELISEGFTLATPKMSLHDHYFDHKTGQWKLWSSKLEEKMSEPSRSQEASALDQDITQLETSRVVASSVMPLR